MGLELHRYLLKDKINENRTKEATVVERKFCKGVSRDVKAPQDVPVFALADITSLRYSIDNLAFAIEQQSPEYRCSIIRKKGPAPARIDFSVISNNAGYVRYSDKAYYINKEKNESEPIIKFAEKFDRKIEELGLGFDEEAFLNDDDLADIIYGTMHVHDNHLEVNSIYNESSLDSTYQYDGASMLDQEHIDIEKRIENYFKSKSGPYVLVAYSYSSLLAIEIMQYLYQNKPNARCLTYIIDSLSPEENRKFFQSKSGDPDTYFNTLQYVDNIIEIANYCASLLSILPLNNATDEFKSYLQTCPPGECLVQIANQIKLQFDCGANSSQFDNLINFVKLRLERIHSFKKEIHKPLPGELKILLTDETRSKCPDDQFGGWEGYAESIEFVGYTKNARGEYVRDPNSPEASLLSATHQNVVQEPYVQILADSILAFKSKINQNYVNSYNQKPEQVGSNQCLPKVTDSTLTLTTVLNHNSEAIRNYSRKREKSPPSIHTLFGATPAVSNDSPGVSPRPPKYPNN